MGCTPWLCLAASSTIFCQRQHFGETVLVQAHFLHTHEVRDFLITHLLECSGRQAIINRIKHHQNIRCLNMLHQINALRPAIQQLHIRRKSIMGMQVLQHPHPKTFIRPKQIANAKDQYRRICLSIQRILPCTHGRSSLNIRQPLTIVLIRLCRDMMSSRIAT